MRVIACDRCDQRIPISSMELEIDELDEEGGTKPWRLSTKAKYAFPDAKGVSVDLCWTCFDELRAL